MEKELNGQKYKVEHILRDGTVLDSIKGHMIEVNEKTETFYRMLANLDDEELERLERLGKEKVNK
ncbi:hypothetical protein SH1V18_03560 [Vallitalea longa]|uniref:Uncharacterized protein n=1 Tax=Vallitalea longa TaxID=2936439 RepID=A0A9W5Y8C7_9FIRM|nr:hypothetical protein [Vallitalea longa]GKX27876.1 hypothetical protein SH1V18_03560 [Vallitalea longa]